MNWDMLQGIVRHALTFGGGYLVTSGLADATQVDTGVGAICTIIGLVWSIVVKIESKKA